MPDLNLASRRPLVVCADDYALAPGVSRGILELLEAGRISAVSCMSLSGFWPDHAAWLKPFVGRVDIGLHLTLTQLKPLGPMPKLAPAHRLPDLGLLLRTALLRNLPLAEVQTELLRQFDAFVRSTGRSPDFLDGHQHIHLLPGIRDQVLALYRRRLAGTGAWVRNCVEPTGAILVRGVDPAKAMLIACLGRRLARQLKAAHIPANDSFRGVHDFSEQRPYAALFDRFLRGGGARPVIMCHPGHVDAALEAVDSLTHARESEWRYFSGDAYPAALDREGYRLARFKEP